MSNFPITWPHRASAGHTPFRGESIVPYLTEQNWNGHGVLYYDADRTVVHATVQRGTRGTQTFWAIARLVYTTSHLINTVEDERHDTLSAAIRLLATDVRTANLEHGPVLEDAWPEDTDAPWILFTPPKRGV